MEILNLNKDNFDELALAQGKTVLVDFHAKWCGPCRAMGIIIDKFAEERSSEISITKVDIDENPELASKYQIFSVPTLMLIRDGVIVKIEPGFKSKEALERFIRN